MPKKPDMNTSTKRDRLPKWREIGQIPKEKPIRIKTVRGLECIAIVRAGQKIRFPDQKVKVKRINAKRLHTDRLKNDKIVEIGDVRAVAWRGR